jgi:DNA-binding transcriptional ArsR family regulator
VIRKKLLIDPNSKDLNAKRVLTSDNPEVFSAAFSALGNTILSFLSKGPSYPSNIARKLGKHHQIVYYHMHRLERAGLIKQFGHESVRGGRANLYKLTSAGYAIEFDVKEEIFHSLTAVARSSTFGNFFKNLFVNNEFDGWIVVGSPEPHGPDRTQGRDGHYAVQLGFALGQFVRLPTRFPVKLDVDIKNEKLEHSNLIIVGGPRTNIMAAEVNPHLPIRFSEESFWGSIVDDKGKRYFSELDALIVKTKNPWEASRTYIIIAGLTSAATKAAMIGLTNLADQVLDSYSEGDFAVVLRGADLDGDGKVDSVEVLHKF